jgi:hypothetical protein
MKIRRSVHLLFGTVVLHIYRNKVLAILVATFRALENAVRLRGKAENGLAFETFVIARFRGFLACWHFGFHGNFLTSDHGRAEDGRVCLAVPVSST